MRGMTRESVTKVAVLVLVLWGFWFPSNSTRAFAEFRRRGVGS